MDLDQLLSDWLMYVSAYENARFPQRVQNMFGFYVIKRYEMRLL